MIKLFLKDSSSPSFTLLSIDLCFNSKISEPIPVSSKASISALSNNRIKVKRSLDFLPYPVTALSDPAPLGVDLLLFAGLGAASPALELAIYLPLCLLKAAFLASIKSFSSSGSPSVFGSISYIFPNHAYAFALSSSRTVSSVW